MKDFKDFPVTACKFGLQNKFYQGLSNYHNHIKHLMISDTALKHGFKLLHSPHSPKTMFNLLFDWKYLPALLEYSLEKRTCCRCGILSPGYFRIISWASLSSWAKCWEVGLTKDSYLWKIVQSLFCSGLKAYYYYYLWSQLWIFIKDERLMNESIVLVKIYH